jgi:outer membrane immunogenic protein
VRIRAGVPIDNLLIYVTGGVMFGGVTAAQTVSFVGSDQAEAVTRRRALAGPTVGGGVEFLLSNPWAVKLEALYYDLGDLKTASHPINGAPANFTDFKTFGFRGAIVRLGVDLHLGDLIF